MEGIDDIYQKGCLELKRRKIEQALNYFNNIICENSNHCPSLNKIGVIYAQNGDIAKAKEYFEMALDVDEGYVPALVNLGNVFKEEGDNETAEALYKDAIKKDNDYYLAYYNLAVLYKAKGEYELYIRNYKKYKKLYRKKIDYEAEKEFRGNLKQRKIKNVLVVFLIGICLLVFFILKNN